MRPNRLKQIWARGEAVVNGWVSIPHSFAAETMAHQGWDSLTVDMQHGVVDYAGALAVLTGISTTDVVPMVRVPWLDAGILMKMLDAGAYGLICPMINTADEAELFVRSTTYPPNGDRSYGPIRAFLYGGQDYPQKANGEIVRFAMIETKKALDNLKDILKVPGLDAVYIGPADLSNALGCTPKFDQDEKPVVEAIDYILKESLAAGKIAGIHNGTTAYAKKMIEKGFRFVTIGSDARLMAAGARAIVTDMKGANAAPVGGASKTY
jgi:4-hydroxy-2-oxoheptanedioate aldolase